MIIFFILITKQALLCGKCKENLHTDQLAGAERVKAAAYKISFKSDFLLFTISLCKIRIPWECGPYRHGFQG